MLKNKLGITNSLELAKAEERISKKKAVELFEKGVLDKLEAGRIAALQAIHKHLFEDIYDFAGKIRDVNIAKGTFRFAPVMYLEASLANIDKMPQATFDEIIEKYVEMNIAHPFREGNGRTFRILANLMARKQGYPGLNFKRIDFNEYIIAVQQVARKDYSRMELIIAYTF